METYIKAYPPFSSNWIRPTDWLAMPTVVSTDDTFVGLYAIFPNGNNFAAFNFTTSAGQYQVDWGDGNVTLHNSGVAAEYEYNYSTYDIGNTTLTSRGYKQAIIKVTPVSGLLRTCNFNLKYTGQNQIYSTGFLDCILSMPNANSGTSIVFGGGNIVVHRLCERFDVKTIGGCTSMASMFNGCIALQSVPLFNTGSVTNMSSMFLSCYSLQSVPLFNTGSVNNMTNMFFNCYSLQSVPLFNTGSVTNMVSMFQNCYSLKTVPLFNTGSVTNMVSMFQNCYSLKTVPLFNTGNVTNMVSMFANCHSLKTVPLFNTSNVTLMGLGQNTSGMFQNCYSLQSVPLFNTANVSNFFYAFQGCYSLQSVPLFNTSNAINIGGMFADCISLQSIPALSTVAAVEIGGFSNFATGCASLDRCEVSFTFNVNLSGCQLSKTALEEIFTNLVSRIATSQTITIGGNYGVGTIVSRTFTITDGSTTITTANTSSLVAGMQVTGTGSPLTTAVAVTFQDAGDTVTLLSHGLENGDEVSFATVVSTTGIALNTIYYVINKTTDTFQLATSIGGSAILLTTDGSGTMRHRTEIVSIVPNTSITMSRPMRGTGTPTLAFRLLRTGTALLKNWAVTG